MWYHENDKMRNHANDTMQYHENDKMRYQENKFGTMKVGLSAKPTFGATLRERVQGARGARGARGGAGDAGKGSLSLQCVTIEQIDELRAAVLTGKSASRVRRSLQCAAAHTTCRLARLRPYSHQP